ncbi:MAG: hypothetical protein JST84_16645 [Acidobacteria bacterium]|nr:hypothetical protein [Acidobacteriota bacterium]
MPEYDSALFSPPAPVAKAMLRNPDTGVTLADIPMLIDSGADVTLLPMPSVNILGIIPDVNQTFELTGFDGNRSAAQAVRADLIFQRKTFKGNFLLINQEVGYIGRDILNHLSLTLDGPRLVWEMR